MTLALDVCHSALPFLDEYGFVFYTMKCVIFDLKMHQNVFGGRALKGPAVGAYSAPPGPWMD